MVLGLGLGLGLGVGLGLRFGSGLGFAQGAPYLQLEQTLGRLLELHEL